MRAVLETEKHLRADQVDLDEADQDKSEIDAEQLSPRGDGRRADLNEEHEVDATGRRLPGLRFLRYILRGKGGFPSVPFSWNEILEVRKCDTAGAVCPKHVSQSDNHLLPVERMQVRSTPGSGSVGPG